MGDSNQSQNKSGLPLWQKKLNETTPTEEEKTSPSEPPPSRETVIEQAKKFLEEDEVKNASTDKKITFLESKGLRSSEIQQLIGVSRNADASTTDTIETSQPNRTSPTQSPPQKARDTPPIITYPEFLTTPSSPPPLITQSRVLTALYLFGGLSALLYGTNNYLITPMLASLTTSRLSLTETASTNLTKLIAKLEAVVSEVPRTRRDQTLQGGERDSREEDSDEDPTELFHRDIGVQTSSPPTPSSSRRGSPAPQEISPLEDQTTRLGVLNSHLTSLMEESTSEGQEASDLTATIGVLRDYLDGLAYVAPTFGYGIGAYASGMTTSGQNPSDDEIARVKASIRSVKGVLLSAKSFPRGK